MKTEDGRRWIFLIPGGFTYVLQTLQKVYKCLFLRPNSYILLKDVSLIQELYKGDYRT